MAIRNVVVRGYGPGASIAFVVTRGYTIGTGPPTASVGVSAALTEPLLVDGGQVITITLSNDTWLPPGSSFDQVRQIILNGLTSSQSEVTGFNKEVRDKQPVTAVVRTSNTLVTITLIAAPGYNITVDVLHLLAGDGFQRLPAQRRTQPITVPNIDISLLFNGVVNSPVTALVHVQAGLLLHVQNH